MTATPKFTLKLISSMATRAVLTELLRDYQRRTAQAVEAEAGGGVEIAKRVQAGEYADGVVLAANVIDKLIGEGKLLPGRVDVVRSGIAVAVRAGAARPDIGSEAAVRQAVTTAKTLSYSTGPSGIYLEQLLERWGVLAALRSRIVVAPPGVPVGSLVADGRAEIGFQQLSELATLPGITVLGPLPPDIQLLTTFSAGVPAVSSHAAAARELLAQLAAPDTAALKQRHGMEPG